MNIGVIQRTVAETPWDPATLADHLDRVADLGYDGIELSGGGLDGLEVSALAAELDANDLAVPSAFVGTTVVDGHIELQSDDQRLAGDPAETAATYREVGCRGFSGGNPFDIESGADIDRAVEAVAAFADRLADHGVTLQYHNHAHEFHEVDGRTFFDELAETDVTFEVDVGHVERGGRNPAAVIRELSGQIDIVHMSDVDEAGNVVELGDGLVDFEAVAAASRDAGADWLVYEYNQTSDHETSLVHGAEFLDAL
jgi:sugar phosphate isomerase/epimerase